MGVGAFFKGLVPYLSVAAETFGGPAGAIAASVLTKATGSTVKPTDIAKTIQNLSMSEDGRIKLDAAEKEYAETMARMGFESAEKLAQTAAEDRASARQMQVQVRSWVVPFLAIGITLGFFTLLFLMIWHPPPATSAQTMNIMLGALVTAWVAVVTYYFGSSAGSDRKTEIMVNGNGNGH